MTRPAGTRIRGLAARIDAATPAHRDRTVDALRALAIAGVILGHWMVTALVLSHGRTGGTLHDASPLAALPALTPVSWIFQTLAIFFFVGGYAAARSYSGGYLRLAAQAPGPADPPGGRARGRLGAARRRAVLGGVSRVDPAHRAHAGAVTRCGSWACSPG